MSVIELDRRIGFRSGPAGRPPAVDDERFAHVGWEPRRKVDSFCQGRSRVRAWCEFALTMLVMFGAIALIAAIRTWVAVGDKI